MRRSLFTSESVTEGHPDKIADQISDAVLDAILSQDPFGRVACETLVTTGLVLVSGEITTDCYVDIPRLVRSTIQDIGYTRAKYGFDGETCAVITSLDEQSTDIALGVDQCYEAKKGESAVVDFYHVENSDATNNEISIVIDINIEGTPEGTTVSTKSDLIALDMSDLRAMYEGTSTTSTKELKIKFKYYMKGSSQIVDSQIYRMTVKGD